jgi:hypothetical protein
MGYGRRDGEQPALAITKSINVFRRLPPYRGCRSRRECLMAVLTARRLIIVLAKARVFEQERQLATQKVQDNRRAKVVQKRRLTHHRTLLDDHPAFRYDRRGLTKERWA